MSHKKIFDRVSVRGWRHVTLMQMGKAFDEEVVRLALELAGIRASKAFVYLYEKGERIKRFYCEVFYARESVDSVEMPEGAYSGNEAAEWEREDDFVAVS